MKKPLTLKILLVFSLLLSVAKLSAQVHIGADVAPQPFSVLELYAQYKTDTYGGLRLPQMDSLQRNALSRTYGTQALFEGLMIYNTTTQCVEYWNSKKWVSLCLGTADINLVGDNCTYDPAVCIPASAEPCAYSPKETPPCASGQPYLIHLVAGFAYTTIQIVDEFTSTFTVTFDENNTAFPRIAVVRVTNNCTGEFKDFPFTQCAGDCPGGNAFSVTSNSTVLCGTNGAVIAWVTNPQDGMDYVWGYNGVPVHTGNYYEIRRPGKYTVYAGLFGCTDPAPQEIIITQTIPGNSPSAPFAIASNSSIICSNGSVILTAYNTTYPVQWFQNGKMYNGTYSDGTAGPPSANPLIVNTASAAGEWFAVQIDVPCGSRMSNIVTLVYLDIPSLPAPCAKVNGTLIDNIPPPVICKNGTLELEICNHGAYPPGTVYEWFANGVGIWYPTTNPIIYTTPLNLGTTTFSVQASNSGTCPSTATSVAIAVIHDAPPSTVINNGADKAAICGDSPAILLALNTSGAAYEWFRNTPLPNGICQFEMGVVYNKMPSGISRYDADTTSCYAVRYKDANGCWSPLSRSIQVIQSSVISLRWVTPPPDTANFGTQATYEVAGSPKPDSYAWTWWSLTSPTPSPNVVTSFVSVPPDYNAISVSYIGAAFFPNGTDTIIIRTEATNLCGTVPLQKKVYVRPGCVPITAVNINPSGTVSRNIDDSGIPLPGHEVTNFVATALNGTLPSTGYDWYVNDILQFGFTSNTFTFNTPPVPGSYRIYAVAKNACSQANTATTTVIVEACATANSANYRIDGKMCYDVNQTNGTVPNQCMATSERRNDFLDGYIRPYKFSSPTNQPYTILEWSVIGPAGVATMPARPGFNTSDLTFTSSGPNSIITQATGRDKSTALKFTIVVRFTPNTTGLGACMQATLDVYVQDCVCGCSVRSTLTASPYNGWITFLCYNLGVPQSAKSWSIAQQMAYTPINWQDSTVAGGWFQFGRSMDGHQRRFNGNGAANNALGGGPVPVADLNPITGQLTTTSAWAGKFVARPDNTNWLAANVPDLWNAGTEMNPIKTVYDPCPPGWRVPTSTEWCSIFRGTNTAGAFSAATANTITWLTTGPQGLRVSPDGGTTTTLFIPEGRYRYSDGTIGSSLTYNINYQSSTPQGTVFVYRFQARNNEIRPAMPTNSSRANGFSLRCVAE